MKEFCGYKSLDGSLHETQQSCEKADYEFKVREIVLKFDNIGNFIRNKVHQSYLINRDANISEYEIQEIMISIFANNRKELLAIYNQGDLMKKELDKLKEDNNKSTWSNKWWLKFKWWN